MDCRHWYKVRNKDGKLCRTGSKRDEQCKLIISQPCNLTEEDDHIYFLILHPSRVAVKEVKVKKKWKQVDSCDYTEQASSRWCWWRRLTRVVEFIMRLQGSAIVLRQRLFFTATLARRTGKGFHCRIHKSRLAGKATQQKVWYWDGYG